MTQLLADLFERLTGFVKQLFALLTSFVAALLKAFEPAFFIALALPRYPSLLQTLLIAFFTAFLKAIGNGAL